ncbi:MAG: NAD(P)H-dependent oxidoreductase [Chitinophagales bacterium]|nr:NAD(P)H-dependent oxidoreductase [Chitinophagales bacterium]
MGKKILIVNGHPNKESLNFALAEAYKKGALESGAEIKEINISDLQFNPNLQYGYKKRTELEPDLLESWDKIKWAEHLVFVFPIWWGGMPAMLKGFFDRLFLPGFAFQYRENSVWWDKLLTGKSAHIIATMDTPYWYFRLIYGNPGIQQFKRTILQFSGINPVKVTVFSPIKNVAADKIKKHIDKTFQIGKQLK